MIERLKAGCVLDTHDAGAIEFELGDGIGRVVTVRDSRYPFHWRRVPIQAALRYSPGPCGK
jgi:hypothetical protein